MARTFGSCGEITVQATGGVVVDSLTIASQAASGSSGILFQVTPATGKKVIVTALMPDTTIQTNIEIKFGSRVIYTGNISDDPSSGSLTISQGAKGSNTNEYTANSQMLELSGDTDEVLTITKTSATTTAIIYLSYKIAS